MNNNFQSISESGKYISERTEGSYIIKLYLWEEDFYELSYYYGYDEIIKAEKLKGEEGINVYIENINRTVPPEVHWYDKDEKLREKGKHIKQILEENHPEFLNKLYWDKRLNWFCQVIETKAAYLVDKIKTDQMSIKESCDVAIRQLLEVPETSMKAPYVSTSSDGVISFPNWFMFRKSQQDILIDDVRAYGDSIREVLGRLDRFGGWEEIN